MQDHVTEYESQAYRPGEQQHMPYGATISYTARSGRDHFSSCTLPWGSYLGREEACTIMVTPPQNSWQNLTAMFSKERKSLIPASKKYLFNESLPLSRVWSISNTQMVFKGINFIPPLFFFPIVAWILKPLVVYLYWMINPDYQSSFFFKLVFALPFVFLFFAIIFILFHFLSFPPRFILDRPSGMVIKRRPLLFDRKIPFVHYDAMLGQKKDSLKYNGELWCRYKVTGVIFAFGVDNPGIVYLRWQFIQRFMDVTQPLPDIPALEPYRHLDSTTAEHDKKIGRPERYWRDKSMEEINAMAEKMAREEENIQPVWPCTMAPFIEGRNLDEPMVLPIPKPGKKV